MAGTTISKRLSEKIQEVRKLKDTLKLRDNKILELNEKILALGTQLSLEEAKVKKWETMQMNGYTAVAINDGYIMEAVTVPPYCTFTFTQDIPKEIGSRLYSNFPFVKLNEQGKMIFDSQQYKKYKGVY